MWSKESFRPEKTLRACGVKGSGKKLLYARPYPRTGFP
jgi:hypothetical protein